MLACGASGGRVGHLLVVRVWWRKMRTALALRVGLSGGRKCVHGRDVGLGKVAIMMAAKKDLGRHSSSICCGVGMRQIGVVMVVLRRVHMWSWGWGGTS